MWSWLKYFPLECRYNNSPSEIGGPFLKKQKKQVWHIGGDTLSFMAPRTNNVYSFTGLSYKAEKQQPGKNNILTSDWPSVFFSTNIPIEDQWEVEQFYSITWPFVGPWMSGYQARLRSSAVLVKATKNSNFASTNLFHPRTFETAIADYLNRAYGYKKSNGKPHYRGPLNWKLFGISRAIKAVICDIHIIGNSSKENPSLYRLVLLPVTATSFIRINFDFGDIDIHRENICSEPLLTLCDSIISSLRLEMGEKTKAEWEKVKATCPDMSITESFGELPWPLKHEKPSKKNKEIDVTPKKQKFEIDHDSTQ